MGSRGRSMMQERTPHTTVLKAGRHRYPTNLVPDHRYETHHSSTELVHRRVRRRQPSFRDLLPFGLEEALTQERVSLPRHQIPGIEHLAEVIVAYERITP